ncbi:zinc ribbon domain-containing protein [Peribacillus sp. NPDC096540]|uniref:zinc ribbon domain-containing protein n=1 Tax=Peribacillus sp. NPDC096540 TaxID=3390612 RepID=UPI003D02E790
MKYICNDCVLVFETHGKLAPRKIAHCPNCGDNVATVNYTTPLKGAIRRGWSQEEMELLDRCIKGEFQIYAVAHKIGRSSKSVKRQIQRIKNNESRIYEGAWTIKEEQTIRDYLDEHGTKPGYYKDLTNLLGRNINQVRCKVFHMRKKGMLGAEA